MSNGCGFHMGWTIHQWFMSIIFRSKTWVTDAKKRAWNTRRMSDTRFFGGNLGIFLCLINEFLCVGSSVAAVLSKPIHWTYPSISHSPIAVSHAFSGGGFTTQPTSSSNQQGVCRQLLLDELPCLRLQARNWRCFRPVPAVPGFDGKDGNHVKRGLFLMNVVGGYIFCIIHSYLESCSPSEYIIFLMWNH